MAQIPPVLVDRGDGPGQQLPSVTIPAVAGQTPDACRVLPPDLTVVVQRQRDAPSPAGLGADQRDIEVQVARANIDLLAVASPVTAVGPDTAPRGVGGCDRRRPDSETTRRLFTDGSFRFRSVCSLFAVCAVPSPRLPACFCPVRRNIDNGEPTVIARNPAVLQLSGLIRHL